jgi:hypothetical protein
MDLSPRRTTGRGRLFLVTRLLTVWLAPGRGAWGGVMVVMVVVMMMMMMMMLSS